VLLADSSNKLAFSSLSIIKQPLIGGFACFGKCLSAYVVLSSSSSYLL
jgi:hypothetical protein